MHLLHWSAGQTCIIQHGGSVIRPAAKTGGSVEDGELKPATGAAGQLQPFDQAGDGGLQHEGQSSQNLSHTQIQLLKSSLTPHVQQNQQTRRMRLSGLLEYCTEKGESSPVVIGTQPHPLSLSLYLPYCIKSVSLHPGIERRHFNQSHAALSLRMSSLL